MNQSPCEFEQQIIHAARIDAWTEQLRQHLAKCQPCREAHQVAMSLAQLAAKDEVFMPPALDPNLLWLKAEVREQRLTQTGRNFTFGGIAVIAAVSFFLVYRFVSGGTGAETSSALPIPFADAPFPLDATLVFLLIAVALVFLLPSAGTIGVPRRSKQEPMTL